jgi:hypothetical protein
MFLDSEVVKKIWVRIKLQQVLNKLLSRQQYGNRASTLNVGLQEQRCVFHTTSDLDHFFSLVEKKLKKTKKIVEIKTMLINKAKKTQKT